MGSGEREGLEGVGEELGAMGERGMETETGRRSGEGEGGGGVAVRGLGGVRMGSGEERRSTWGEEGESLREGPGEEKASPKRTSTPDVLVGREGVGEGAGEIEGEEEGEGVRGSEGGKPERRSVGVKDEDEEEEEEEEDEEDEEESVGRVSEVSKNVGVEAEGEGEKKLLSSAERRISGEGAEIGTTEGATATDGAAGEEEEEGGDGERGGEEEEAGDGAGEGERVV